MNKSILERLQDMIRDITGNKDVSVSEKSRLVEDLDFDSVDFASLVMTVEEEFDGSVDESELDDIKTVGDIVTLINSKLAI
jgi:acyl carrier protein